MITLSKLLPEGSKPAPVLLARMKRIPLTFAQRSALPPAFEAGGESYEVKAEGMRPLEVDDLFMDDKGGMYAVGAAPEKVFHVTGPVELMQQAAAALMIRGFRVMETENGFGVVADDNLGTALRQIGLDYTEHDEPFTPVPVPHCGHHHGGGCGCGCGHHHHHGEDEECGCGCGHHHHHGEDEECGCGHHHHHGEGEECGCGHHHHHGEGEECGCGHHHHHGEGEECGCGHHHHHGEGEECGCGHHHHHGEGEECCCGHHHHKESKAD